MHEFSLCKYILAAVQNHCNKQHYHHIKIINLEIGVFSAIDKEALLFAFDILSKKTTAENAALCILHVAGEAWCMTCQKNSQVKQRISTCEVCGEILTIIHGDELRIKSMEVE